MVYKSLKDIAIITMGQSPDSSSYNGDRVGMPFFQGNADFGELYPTERIWCNAPKKIANPNDILISVRAPIGALNMANKECCIGRGLAAITIKDPAERNYVYHLLKAKTQELNSKGTGSTFKAIGKSVLEDVQIPQISKSEQELCMKTMDLLESIIRERQSQLTHLDELIKARFVEALSPYFDSGDTEPLINLVDVARPITYGILKPGTDVDGGLPVIRVKDFSKGLVAVSEVLHTSPDIYNRYLRSILDEGDILLSIGGTIGRIAIVPHEFVGANITQHTARIALKDKRYLLYYKGLFESDIMQQWMKSRVLGVAQPSMNLGDVKIMPIPKVDESRMKELDAFVAQVDKSKSVVRESLEEAKLLFDSLMQEYFG